MHRPFPIVKGKRLYQSGREGDPIDVGTPAWYDWLEHHVAFLFVDRVGTVTVCKNETDPSAPDWKASCTRKGKQYQVTLGSSHALTLPGLQDAARRLAGKHAQVGSTMLSQARPAGSTPHVPKTATTVGPPGSLIQTKLYRPRSGSDVIPRARLLERLNAGLGGNITLISAPAGFGKTTLLAEWLQTIECHTAWLSLDANDNELRIFVHSFTTALQTVFSDALQATASLFQAEQFPPADRVAPLLINDLADMSEDVVLVLDDYHLIHHSDVHTLLDQLIEHQTLPLHLVLASRSDPPLPLARWLAKGQLNELRRDDLRFTREETQDFLTRVLGSISARETVVALQERTDGWIAVLRLATLSLRGTSDQAAFLQRLHHHPDRNVSSYLVEEILSQLAPSVQELLLQTSILEQFCAELCIAILGSDASHVQVQATLDWLERSNTLVIPLDERHGWYRFHHLFQQLLRQRLQARISREELSTLHRRASGWYAAQGLIEEALEHALAAEDAAYAAQLVESRVLWAYEQEQLAQMELWLDLLPEEQIQGSPILLFARVWILQARGQLKDLPPLLTTAGQLLDTSGSGTSDPDDQHSRIIHALLATGWSHFQYFTGQVQAGLESARSALEWMPPGEEHIAGHAMQYLAWSYQATGQEDVALVKLQQALRELPAILTITARLLLAQALVYLAVGKLHQVEHIARHLLRLAQQADLVMSQNYAHWLLGVVFYEQNNLDAVVYHFSAVIANQHLAHFWMVRDAMCGLALAYQAQGLGTQAQETAHSLLAWVQEQHNMPELMTTYAFCGRLALLQNEVESAEPWLEMAGEQDVLAGPMLFIEDPPITKAWMLLAKGDQPSIEHGQALLSLLLQHVESIHSTRKTIQVLALQAWAYNVQGRESEALEVLERALALARPGEFIRTFADLLPLAKVLHELRKRRRTHQEVDKQLDTYLQRLLAAMNPVAAHPMSPEALMQQEGLEPLTSRELHILHLLEKDLTNKEIARELLVTPGTVKVHTKNVYRKLGVNNRRAAVSLTKALGLLTP